ncbi:hypothetical protein [Dactylosporangium darangshiense]|uniref:Uncharacterized protein n=1 Tax=Dactylosporangium darangshiense TaxID=579108 RepID=A0ABP8DMN8_9ACTN
MLRRRHRAAPVGATVIYHGSIAELTGRAFTITHVDTSTGRARYELSDAAGPLLDNVHADSFTIAPADPADQWAARLDAIGRAAARNDETVIIAPYLAEVRALIARGDQRSARDAARALEYHLGLRTGHGAHRR